MFNFSTDKKLETTQDRQTL